MQFECTRFLACAQSTNQNAGLCMNAPAETNRNRFSAWYLSHSIHSPTRTTSALVIDAVEARKIRTPRLVMWKFSDPDVKQIQALDLEKHEDCSGLGREYQKTIRRQIKKSIHSYLEIWLIQKAEEMDDTIKARNVRRVLQPVRVTDPKEPPLNASDARGINVVREQVLSFASTKSLFAGKFKLVILDEADSMTKDAQNALRRIVEKFTENTRFCLICNYLSKIIPAIQSRCTKFRFAPVSFQQMQPRLKEIATTEKVVLTDDGMKAIYRFTSGDMRKAINLMQSAAMSAPKIDESSVYACVAYPSPAEIRSLTDSMLNEPIHSAFKNMLATKNLKGIALQDILTELHPLVMKINFPDSVRCDLIIALAELEHRMSVGASERLQLAALVASFARAKSSLEQVAG
ncbi:replication factor C subunit 3/5 [Clonorchis sinensis]|uniref:Replication factor C subunit 3/5 n=1 Tax=Clonorchis sinensis TaxID=79923 RepID=G7YDM1_CLOSI|nr:replication factor C subunit 3/5 [Clonorchis sinensis]